MGKPWRLKRGGRQRWDDGAAARRYAEAVQRRREHLVRIVVALLYRCDKKAEVTEYFGGPFCVLGADRFLNRNKFCH